MKVEQEKNRVKVHLDYGELPNLTEGWIKYVGLQISDTAENSGIKIQEKAVRFDKEGLDYLFLIDGEKNKEKSFEKIVKNSLNDRNLPTARKLNNTPFYNLIGDTKKAVSAVKNLFFRAFTYDRIVVEFEEGDYLHRRRVMENLHLLGFVDVRFIKGEQLLHLAEKKRLKIDRDQIQPDREYLYADRPAFWRLNLITNGLKSDASLLDVPIGMLILAVAVAKKANGDYLKKIRDVIQRRIDSTSVKQEEKKEPLYREEKENTIEEIKEAVRQAGISEDIVKEIEEKVQREENPEEILEKTLENVIQEFERKLQTRPAPSPSVRV